MLSKDKVMEVIADWSFWQKDLPATKERRGYEAELGRKASSGDILVIKGVRRSGKSTLLINEIKRLRSKGVPAKDILMVNLEDPRFVNYLGPALLDRIKDTYVEYMQPDSIPYIMLDEVQNVPYWEKWVLKEYDLGKSRVYVTGSNSSLLDTEIGAALSGRYLDVVVFPLSFTEFLEFNNLRIWNRAERLHYRNEIDRLYRRYSEQGGFPKLVEITDDETKRDTLKVYFDSILLRDIMTRSAVGHPRALEELAVFLLSNAASANSTNRLKNIFSMSFDAVKEYTRLLEEAFLIFQLPRFDWSLKKQLVNPRKFYSVDTGLSNRMSFRIGGRNAQNLENIVFLELLRRKGEIYYFKTAKQQEVDFVLKEGAKIVELIQVCVKADEPKTLDRETTAFAKAERELGLGYDVKKTLLTLAPPDEELERCMGIKVRNVIDWLLFPLGS